LPSDIESSQLPTATAQLMTPQGSFRARHSMVGIFATAGAAVMFAVILAFMQISQAQADKISQTPGANVRLAQQKFDTMQTVAKVIGISSVLASFFWISLSFRSPTKKLWNIVGFASNGALLIWILFAPLGMRVADVNYTPEQITENYRERVYSIIVGKSVGS